MGVFDVDAMLAQMSSRQFAEWIAYHNLEPFGDELLDIHLAKFQAMMASSKGDAKKVQDFRVWKDTEKFDPQEFFEGLKSVMST